MSDGMPDDWRDVVKKITDDWSDNLEDLMVKHSEAEFLKHAASTGVNFNLIQTEALKKLVLEDVGFVAQTNKKIGQSIIDDIEKLLITKGDWASAKDAVLEHVNNVFSGQEKIVIDNIGKQVKRAVLDAELGHVVLKDFTVKRKWAGNVNAYSDMVAKSLSQKARTMGDLEGYRTTTGIIGWRRMSSLGGRTCELCASLHGRAYYFAGEGVDTLPSDDGLMFEPHPNGFCYQAPIYDDWTGLKNINEAELYAHLERWKADTKSPFKNLKKVPDSYGRPEIKPKVKPKIEVEVEPKIEPEIDVDVDVDVSITHKDSGIIDMPPKKRRVEFELREDITQVEKESIREYTVDGYKQINRSAANRKTKRIFTKYTDEEVGQHIKNIDTSIGKSILKDDITLYRGVKPHIVKDLMENNARESLGFTSASSRANNSMFFATKGDDGYKTVLVFERKSGQTGLFINTVENEYILPRGIKYRSTKIVEFDTLTTDDVTYTNIRLIFVEVY